MKLACNLLIEFTEFRVKCNRVNRVFCAHKPGFLTVLHNWFCCCLDTTSKKKAVWLRETVHVLPIVYYVPYPCQGTACVHTSVPILVWYLGHSCTLTTYYTRRASIITKINSPTFTDKAAAALSVSLSDTNNTFISFCSRINM